VLALVHTLAGLGLGATAGYLLRLALDWPEAPAVLAAAGCVGQVCRALLAYTGRPSEETLVYQFRIQTPAVVASGTLGLVSTLTLLQFPATIVVPAASYLLVRVLLSWEHGSVSGRGLQFAARGGEILTLLAAIIIG